MGQEMGTHPLTLYYSTNYYTSHTNVNYTFNRWKTNEKQTESNYTANINAAYQ